MGGKSTSTSEPKLNQIKVQTSAYGVAIGRGWGTFRASCNLLHYTDFTAVPHTTTTSTGGKGGGGKSSNTTYTYTASIILGICQGPISGIRSVYRDKSVFLGDTALSQAGLSLATGAIGQGVWGYLSSRHPSEAIGYSGIAYAYAANYALSDGAGLPNHSFEVQTANRAVVGGAYIDDALPMTIISEFLAETPLWPVGLIGDLSDYGLYTVAADLLLSPYLDSQRQASDFLTEILTATNSDAVWSDGVLKVAPYGDVALQGNGVTWTPNLTPVYDLTEADFIAGGDGEDPVKVSLKEPADCYNNVQVEFLDRTHQYNTNVVPGIDQASIDAYGVRKQDPVSLHSICDPVVAAQVAQIMVQRSCYVRQTFQFTLGDNYCLLEPMIDLVTLTSGDLNRQLVRITEIAENADGTFDVTAEEVLVGAASAPKFSRQAAGGPAPNYDVSPGPDVNVVLINPPAALLNGTVYEAWLAVAGGQNWGGCEVWASLDGTNYERQGVVNGPARFGVINSTLGAVADPDTTSTLAVDLSASNGTLLGASQADADGLATLCLVDGELISYRDAALVSAHHYNLGYLRRGANGTAVAGHAPGAIFVRLDQGIWKFPYQPGQVGKTLHLKFRSFNVYGRALQDLSAVADYTIALNPNAAPETPIHWADILGPGKPEDGADVTLAHVAAGVVGQGPLATSPLTPMQVDNTQGGFAPRKTWDFDQDAQGFTASGATLTPTGNGTMIYNPSSPTNWLVTQPFIFNGTDVYVIRMRVKPLSTVSNWTGTVYWGTASYIPIDGTRAKTVLQPSFTVGQWFVLEWDISGDTRYLNQSVRQIRVDLTNNATTQWEIDWFSIGIRAYDPVSNRGIQDSADPTSQNTAAAIAGQGYGATAARSAVDNNYVPIGTNMAVDSDWPVDITGWTIWNGTDLTGFNYAEGGRDYPGYSGIRHVLYSHINNPTNIPYGKYVFGACQSGTFNGALIADLKRYAMPCVAGDRVMFGALIAGHGTVGMYVRVRFFNGSGTVIYEYDVTAPGFTNAHHGGLNGANGDPANFYQAAGYYDAPAGTAYAGILTYAHANGDSPDIYQFVTQPFLVKGQPGQTVPPPYFPGTPDRASDATKERTAAAIVGQTAFATFSAVSPTDMASKIARLNLNGRMVNTLVASNGLITGATLSRNPAYVLTPGVSGGAAYITVSAFTLTGQGISASYGGGSIAGLAFDTDYYVYAYDPSVAGGSIVYFATTSNASYLGNTDYLFIDNVHTPLSTGVYQPPANPPPGYGGGSKCVDEHAWLPGGKRARDLQVGDPLLMMRPDGDGAEGGAVTAISREHTACVRLTTETGVALVVSTSTPIMYRLEPNGPVLCADAREIEEGVFLPVVDHVAGYRWEALTERLHVADRWVMRISANNGVFAAGSMPDRFIFTHNGAVKP